MEMSYTTNESDDRVLSKDQIESPLTDDGNSGGSSNGGVFLKKGPWTSAEDAILIDYVKKHGEGNWNAFQKHSGLLRCGKSCRLRWANHLRPNLKKGAFNPEEEQLIIELHAKMGNKWARMAAHLPGRTDNEIKNYWNTRIKRRQRAGLPLYPLEVTLQAFQESQQGQNLNGTNNFDNSHHDLLPSNNYEIPDVIFDSLRANQVILPYGTKLPGNTASSMLMEGIGSQYCNFTPPRAHQNKRHLESTTLFPSYSGNMGNQLLSFNQIDGDKNAQSSMMSILPEPDPTSKIPKLLDANQGSNILCNNNFSTSKPSFGAVKLELPSLQSFRYHESDISGWGTPLSTPPLLDSADAFVNSTLTTETVDSGSLSPRNSGLLDALLHEAKALSNAKHHHPCDKSSDSSTVIPGDSERDDCSDPLSPLGHSASSLLSECKPASACGSSLDETPIVEAYTVRNVKSEPVTWPCAPDKEIESGGRLDIGWPWPDCLLDSEWLDQKSSYAEDKGSISNALTTLMGDDDVSSDYRQMVAKILSSSQGQGQGLNNSCAWNNMHAARQMFDYP